MEPYNLSVGDRVRIYLRSSPSIVYDKGIIFAIHAKPEYIGESSNMNLIDNIYIQFDDNNVYDKILKRGWNILYNGEEMTLGNILYNDNGQIMKISVQHHSAYRNEMEIDIQKIGGILISKHTFLIEQYY